MPNFPPKLHVSLGVLLAGATLLVGCQEGDTDSLEGFARAASFEDGAVIGEVQHFKGRGLDGSEISFIGIVDADKTTEVVLPEGVELENRSFVRAYGNHDGDGKLLLDGFELVSGPPQHVIDAERFEARRIATILVFWTEPGLPNNEAAQSMYLSDRSTNVYYGENSYGKETLAGEVFGPYEIPDPGGCNTTGIANGAIQALRDHGHDENDYRQLMYQFPGTSCGFSGLASVGSPQNPARNSWYNGSFGCVVRNQEIGHNYGMGHSHAYNCVDEEGNAVPLSDDCSHVEYGDPFDPMGFGCGHINAVQKAYMGWFDDCNVVHTNMSGLYNILPTELPCNGTQALRFPMSDGRFFYLEYRQRIGEFDGPSGFDGVIAHVAGDINALGPSPYILDIGNNGLLHEGDSYTDPGNTVTFTIIEENDTHAVVDVQFTDGGSGTPSCFLDEGMDPLMEAGAVGSLECAVAPYPGDVEAPNVTITFPEDGHVFEPGADFNIEAEVTDDRYVFELELYVDGEPLYKIQEEPWVWGVYDIPAGTYEFGVVARDARNWAPSQAVTIHVRDEEPSDTEGDTDTEGGSASDTMDAGTGDPGTTTSVSTTGAPDDDGETSDDEESETDDGGSAAEDSGCGCTSGGAGGAPAWILVLMSMFWMRRRRSARA